MRRMAARRDAQDGVPARLAGAAAVVLFHGCVALALLSNPVRQSGAGAQDAAILVHFIVRTQAVEVPAARPGARHRRHRPSPARASAGRSVSAPAPVPPSPDAGASAGSERSLQLQLPAMAIQIPDDPLRRPDRSVLDRPERTHFEIADRSLAGTLQRMARARACGELRNALLRSPNSEAAIRKSMERYRCGG